MDFLQGGDQPGLGRVAVGAHVALAPSVGAEEFPELVVAVAHRCDRVLVGVLHSDALHEKAILAPGQLPAMVGLVSLGELFPALLDERVVVVPEHPAPAAAGDLLQSGRRLRGLPDLVGVQGPWNQAELGHEPAPVRDSRRREVVDLAMEAERVVVQSHADHFHGLVELLAVEIVGGRLVGIVETADLGAQRLGLAGHRAPAHTQDPPAAGDVVQRGEVLSQPEWMPLGHDVERHPDPNVLGALRDDGSRQDPVGDDLVALVLEVVLGQPVGVEPQLVAHHSHVDDSLGGPPSLLVVEAPVGGSGRPRARVGQLDPAEKEHAGAHARDCRRSREAGRCRASIVTEPAFSNAGCRRPRSAE